jgi:hypothetical protein
VLDGEVQANRTVLCPLPHESGLAAQQPTQRCDIASTGGREELDDRRRASSIDFSLECAPTGEPVLARNLQLRSGELYARITLAQLGKSFLRASLQIVERRPIRQFGL